MEDWLLMTTVSAGIGAGVSIVAVSMGRLLERREKSAPMVKANKPRRSPSAASTTALALLETPITLTQRPGAKPVQIACGPEERPYLMLAPATQPVANRVALQLSPEIRENLSSLVNMVGKGAVLAKDGYYFFSERMSMHLSPEMKEAILKGGAKMMNSKALEEAFRGNVVDVVSKQVIGQASFKVDNVLKFSSAAGGLWQLAAIATSQKFLADIDRRLGNIETGVADIKKHLVNEQLASVEAGCRTLKDLHAELSTGHFGDHQAVRLERILDQRHYDFVLASKKIADMISSIEAFQGTGNVESDAARLNAQIEELREQLGILLLAARLQIALLELGLALPGYSFNVEHRKASILEELEVIRAFAEQVGDMFDPIQGRLHANLLHFMQRGIVQARRDTLQGKFVELKNEVASSIRDCDQLKTGSNPLALSAPQGEDFEFVFDRNGAVEAVYQVIERPAN